MGPSGSVFVVVCFLYKRLAINQPEEELPLACYTITGQDRALRGPAGARWQTDAQTPAHPEGGCAHTSSPRPLFSQTWENLTHPEPGAQGKVLNCHFFALLQPLRACSCSHGAVSQLVKQQGYAEHRASFFFQGSLPFSKGVNLSFDKAPAAAMSALQRCQQQLLISRASGAEGKGGTLLLLPSTHCRSCSGDGTACSCSQRPRPRGGKHGVGRQVWMAQMRQWKELQQ